MQQLNSKGFSLVEGLLIIIAISLVSFVGYYVWHSQQEVSKVSTSTSRSVDSESAAAAQKAKSVGYLKINELGIKVPVNEKLKGLKYEVSPDGGAAGLTTTAFETAVANCADSSEFSSAFRAITTVTTVSGKYDANTSQLDVYDSFVKQFPNFYLTAGTADGGFCTGSDESKNQMTKQMFEQLSPELKKALENSEQI